jgi:hypothetical protein
MRRDSIRVARDMAYKRTAMLEFTRERPALFLAEEFDRFDRQIHRYAALGEDTQDYARNAKLLESGCTAGRDKLPRVPRLLVSPASKRAGRGINGLMHRVQALFKADARRPL